MLSKKKTACLFLFLTFILMFSVAVYASEDDSNIVYSEIIESTGTCKYTCDPHPCHYSPIGVDECFKSEEREVPIDKGTGCYEFDWEIVSTERPDNSLASNARCKPYYSQPEGFFGFICYKYSTTTKAFKTTWKVELRDKCKEQDGTEKTPKDTKKIPKTAYLKAIRGEAEIDKGGKDKWTDAKEGMVLEEEDFISTGFESEVELIIGGHTITIREMAQVKISRLTEVADDPTKLREVELQLRIGSLKTIDNREWKIMPLFRVVTPTACNAVRGTIFFVKYDDKTKLNEVFVEEGEVAVTDKEGKNEIIVGENEYLSVSEGEFPKEPIPASQIKKEERWWEEDEIQAKEKEERLESKGLLQQIWDFIINLLKKLFGIEEIETKNGKSPKKIDISKPEEEKQIDDYKDSTELQEAHQEYVAAYNKLSDLMARGKGDTPEAQEAYEEYHATKEKYEKISQGQKGENKK